jgi:nicotinate-nucleotide adenylyltransferase
MLALGLDQLRFMPTGQSWQKQSEQAKSSLYRADQNQRLTMLGHLISTTDRSRFDIDTREIERFERSGEPTYSTDTVRELARDHADKRRVLILGADQLRNLASWKHYDRLLDCVHLAVTTRPGFGLQDLPEPVERLVQQHGCDHLPRVSHGHIVFFAMSPVPTSSTVLRQAFAVLAKQPEDSAVEKIESAALERYLGKPLLDYIHEQGLYRPLLTALKEDPQRST